MKRGADRQSLKKMVADMSKEARAELLEELLSDGDIGLMPDQPAADIEASGAAQPEMDNDQILRVKLAGSSENISFKQVTSCLTWALLIMGILMLLTYGLKMGIDWLRIIS